MNAHSESNPDEKIHCLHEIDKGAATLLRTNWLTDLLGLKRVLALIDGANSGVLVKEFDVRQQASMPNSEVWTSSSV